MTSYSRPPKALEGKRTPDHKNLSRFKVNAKLLLMVAVAILALIGSMFLSSLIPGLFWVRTVTATLFILFVPGFLALKVLGIRLKSFAESTLMALGLSISIVMLLGVGANILLPYVGIRDPLSLVPMTTIFVVMTTFLAVAASLKNGDVSFRLPLSLLRFRPYHLFLALIPLVTLLGVVVQNSFSSNIVLAVSILMICSIVVLVAMGKVPREAYPMTIFLMGISLLLHTSLISDFLWGWDIHLEYYAATSVIDASYWNPVPTDEMPQGLRNIFSMLSIVILGPVVSILGGAGMDVVLRVVYPFIFSFVPVGLYILFKKQTNEEMALLSSFFVISMFTFFTELPQIARQEIAELFVVLLLLLLVDNEIAISQKKALFVIFAFSLVVSHYGTYYFIITILLIGYVLGKLFDWWRAVRKHEAAPVPRLDEGSTSNAFNLTLVPLLLIISLSVLWYALASGSSPLLTIIDVLDRMGDYILGGIFAGSIIETIGMISAGSGTLLDMIWNVVQVALIVAIIVGIYLLLKKRNAASHAIASINLAALGVLAVCLAVPPLAAALNVSRIFHLALLFLAPSLVLGVVAALGMLSRISRSMGSLSRHSLKIVSAIVILSLAYNSGLMHVAIGAESTSFALDEDHDFPRFTTAEVMGVKWTVSNGPQWVMADEYRRLLFFSFETTAPMIPPPSRDLTYVNSLFYFGKYNLDNREILIKYDHVSWEDSGMLAMEHESSKIYSNPFSEAWYFKG
ncbi:DUF2206 domain-containing protein [Methanomassiliicoccus luminyensis]|uniref:DUF2206 domain-containing protein n=1 Tax=Methanomassiliicoccus luminyensis TaxID=1080712 RepID=UPI00138ADE32|nr:DUF2206 domain-containing protein [Methanomassiliicoccus luminyensis]